MSVTFDLLSTLRTNTNLKSCALHGLGYLKMKKLVLSLAIVTSSAAAIIVVSVTTAETPISTEFHAHNYVASQGKHCNGTVGCRCLGFAPITNGKEWQKSYCKHCGHSKSCHK